MRVLVVLGSSRARGNGVGICAWVEETLRRAAADAPSTTTELVAVSMRSPPLPLGPVDEEAIPAGVREPAKYESERVRRWSEMVSGSAGITIVTPQYNWGYPGELKNALDHLYHEWRGKPVFLVTYGSHGGVKCAAQLKMVLEGSLKMHIAAELAIKLPDVYVEGNERVPANGAVPPGANQPGEFLAAYEADAAVAARSFLAVVHKGKAA